MQMHFSFPEGPRISLSDFFESLILLANFGFCPDFKNQVLVIVCSEVGTENRTNTF